MEELNILIIGSDGYIGSSLCEQMENFGYKCIKTSRKNKSKSIFLDFSDLSSIDLITDELPNLQGLIILPGKEPSQSLDEITIEHMDEMISVHFRGVLWAIKKIRKKINKGGFIITTSSVSSRRGSYDPSYSSMKSAIEGLTRTLARDLSPDIRVNSVAPGLIEGSNVFKKMTSEFRRKHLDTTPLKRFASKEDIVDAYLFLAKNKHMTGQVIHINGGQYFG